jgi:elongation factor 1-alpha
MDFDYIQKIQFSKERFEEIVNEVSKVMLKMGHNPKEVPFIPISSFNGDNLVEPSKNMPWFNGWQVEKEGRVVEGVTLLDAIDFL